MNITQECSMQIHHLHLICLGCLFREMVPIWKQCQFGILRWCHDWCVWSNCLPCSLYIYFKTPYNCHTKCNLKFVKGSNKLQHKKSFFTGLSPKKVSCSLISNCSLNEIDNHVTLVAWHDHIVS